MAIEIVPATVRDVSYVLSHLRPQDHEEIFCQVSDDETPAKLSYLLVMGSACWVAKLDGQPVAAFGVGMLNIAAASGWAFGTKRMKRAIPAITRYFYDAVYPTLVESGVRMVEARSLVSHIEAHRWMLANGAELVGGAFPYGKNGEAFMLFRWTVS